MKRTIAIVTLGLLASVAMGGMSGTYTIKPGGGGDFLSLFAAGEALMDSGMSGNCVFEVLGDTLDGSFGAWGVAGSGSWTTTFRPGPGADPVILGSEFYGGGYNNVKIESLKFLATWITVEGCSGWRISGCRFSTHDWGVKLDASNCDTIDGNVFDVWGTGMGHYPIIIVEGGGDNVIFNNMIGDDSCGLEMLVDFANGRNTRFVYNTLFLSPVDVSGGSCLCIEEQWPVEARNNIFVLAPPSDSANACVSAPYQGVDSILLDNNCYYVESLGYIGGRPFEPYLYNWSEWRGFGLEPHGINADPLLVSGADLHLQSGSPCNQRATPIAGISVDIDGDPRDPTHPDMGADEIAGDAVEERHPPQTSSHRFQTTVVRGVLFLPRAENGDSPPERLRPTQRGTVPIFRATLLDISGRKVIDLRPGANDVRALAPGVYFVRRASGVERVASSVSKVVVTR